MATAPFGGGLPFSEMDDDDVELYRELLIPKVEIQVSGSRYVIPPPPPAMANTSGACVFVNENDDEDSDWGAPHELDETLMVFSDGAVFVEETKPLSIHVPKSSVSVTTTTTAQEARNRRSSQSQATPGPGPSAKLALRNGDTHIVKSGANPRKGKEAKVKCWICGEGYISHLLFQQHMSRVHQVDRPYQCPQCRKRFAKSSLLQKHKSASHSQKKRKSSVKFSNDPLYTTCTLCDKRFWKRATFVRHMRERHKMLPDGSPILHMIRSSQSSAGANPNKDLLVSLKDELESGPQESGSSEGEAD